MKFRRNRADQSTDEVEPTPSDGSDAAAPSEGAGNLRADGPWDVSEVDLTEGDAPRVDLGGLILTARPGVELRLQVDEASQQIVAVLLVTAQGAVELRPFAASRHSDLWGDFRRQIAAETARMGGTATEADGAFGKELRIVMHLTTEEGHPATQPSRVLGIPGPRWLLRATLLGKPALEPDPDGAIESALRDVIVVRGAAAMAPGDPIPLTMPADAEPVEPQD